MQTFLDSKKIAMEKNNEGTYYKKISDSKELSDNKVCKKETVCQVKS